MNMWTFILAGLLLVTLGSAREDAGVYVNGTYSQGKFQKRVMPPTTFICNIEPGAGDWFRINMWELILQDFEKGNNNRNATLLLGTPGLLIFQLNATNGELIYYGFCRPLPKAYQNYNMNGTRTETVSYPEVEFVSVKLKDTKRATMKKGWNYLKNLLTNRFAGFKSTDLGMGAIELTASGEAYMSTDLPRNRRREDDQDRGTSPGISSWNTHAKLPNTNG